MTEELKTIETVDTSPFKHLVMTIGELPTSFVDSMTYYECLAWLVNFLETQVIPAVNNNGEAVEELQALYIELHDYVKNYFDNLDVQEEIDHKLDEMVEDGTFLTLITPIVEEDMAELTSEVNEALTTAQTLNSKADKVLANSINDIRKKYYPRFTQFTLPENITDSFFDDFEILTNNEGKYIVNFKESKYINQGGNTYYLAPDGVNTDDGSYEHPWYTLNSAIGRMEAGDTLIFKNGLYSRTNLQLSETGNTITKSINLKGESKDGVFLTTADYNFSWLQNDTYSDVYETTRSNVRQVIDITRKDEGIFLLLTNVNSLEAVHNTENSWYQNGSTIYVHMYDDVVPSSSNILLGLNLGYTPIVAIPAADSTLYFSDFTIIDGDRSGITCKANGHDVTVFIDNVDMYNITCNGYARDGFSNLGCKSICRNVKIGNVGKDGFNYHIEGTSQLQAKGIEINCTCFDCGYRHSGGGDHVSNNATTAHEASQVVRVNGMYGYCYGAVVADVDSVNSVMLGCQAMDGYGTYDYDVLAQTSTVMYLYDCDFVGSRSTKNLVTSGSDAYIYYNDKTTFDTSNGHVLPITTE